MRGFSVFFALFLFCAQLYATDSPLKGGVYTQGGYAYGRVKPQEKVLYNGTAIKTGQQGQFFIGFSRHAPKNAVLKIISQQGEARVYPFKITPRTYKTQHIKGVKKKHVTPDPKQVARSRGEAQRIKSARAFFRPIKNMAFNFKTPVKGGVQTGVYGSSRTYNGVERNWHKGLDLAAPEGTPITAPSQAFVRAVLADTFFNGNLIILDHGQGLFTIYAHLKDILVTEGSYVDARTVIGTVGQTGRATGPHLHWGAYWHQTPLDPLLFLAHNKTDGHQN